MLRFTQEARNPFEALPLGNGRLGALIYGNAHCERVILNEDTLWSGYARSCSKERPLDYLAEARRLLFAGENLKAKQLIEQHMLGEFSESYMPMGELILNNRDRSPFTAFSRTLSLDRSVATTTYRQNGNSFKRTAYVSAPDDVFVIRWETETPGALSFDIHFTSQLRSTVSADGNDLVIDGQCPDHVEPNYVQNAPDPVVYDEGKGLRFCMRCSAVLTDGSSWCQDGVLHVENTTACTVVCSAANTFCDDRYRERCADILLKALANFEQLERRHIDDFSRLSGRMTLSLMDDQSVYDMDTFSAQNATGVVDIKQYEMLFRLGRYLSICSSRQGLPANLQGIWNWDMRPAWSGNWTTNINLPMNYWPVESCALPECGKQLVYWLQTVIPHGEKAAREDLGAGGWCMHHNVDAWGKMDATKIEARFGFWPMAGVWLCQQIYRHYTYSNDVKFLREHIYPIMEGAVRFCVDWLIQNDKGEWVTCPSTSPENTFWFDGEVCSVAISSSSDIAMIVELFDNFSEACAVLGIDSELLRTAQQKRAGMKWFAIDNGMLLEWDQPFEPVDPGHRHFSHLYGCYPGDLYMDDPALLEASRKAFHHRLDHGGGKLGWSRTWAMALASRYRERPLVDELLESFVLTSVKKNGFDFYVAADELPETRRNGQTVLSDTDRGWFQIDGNFGFTAVVVEFLLQSFCNTVRLLPCLPSTWTRGKIRGLRAPGDVTVDIIWENGALAHADFRTGKRFVDGRPFTLELNGVETVCCWKADTVYRVTWDAAAGKARIWERLAD